MKDYTCIIRRIAMILAASALSLLLAGAEASAVTREVTISARRTVTLTTTGEFHVPASGGSVTVSMTTTMGDDAILSMLDGFSSTLSSAGVSLTWRYPLSPITMSLRFPAIDPSSDMVIVHVNIGIRQCTIIQGSERDMMDTGGPWVRTNTYTGTGTDDYVSDVTYFNGLGLPEMTVSSGASGNGLSLVTPVAYDGCLRPDVTVMLPLEGPDATLRKIAGNSVSGAYQNLYGESDADHAHTDRTFDSYSLGRVTSEMKPGAVYRSTDRAARTEYGASTQADAVLDLVRDCQSEDIHVGVSFLAGLRKTSVTDEDGRNTVTFTDALGRTVLMRQVLTQGGDDTFLDTYTVHDPMGRVSWVISPEGSSRLTGGMTLTPSSELARKWCTVYTYDGYGRMTSRRLPGREEELFVHDAGDRQVLYQDGRLRAEGNRWMYTVYDVLGREVERTVVVPEDAGETAESIRSTVGSSQYVYPQLAGTQDGRAPAGFTFVRHLQSTRYGGQSYRRNDSASSLDLFSIPSQLAFTAVPGFAETSDLSSLTSGLRVYEKLWVQGDADSAGMSQGAAWVERAYHYDVKGRVIQVVERNAWGGTDRTSTGYDYTGNPTAVRETRSVPSGSAGSYDTYTKTTRNTYDDRGRILSSSVTVEGGGLAPTGASAQWTYDALGRESVVRSGDGSVREMSYNTQGWQTGLTAKKSSGTALFVQSLQYHDAPQPQYGGKIGSVTYRQGTSDERSFEVVYDSAGRLASWKPSGSSSFAERNITYDLNGNMTTLKRYNSSSSVTENLAYSYDGNRLTGLTRNGTDYQYVYDGNGSMTSDGLRGLSSVTYGDAGMPVRIEKTDGTAVDYLWLADGTKAGVVSGGSGRAYLGSMVFDLTVGSAASGAPDSGNVTLTFESAAGVCGRIVKSGGSTVPNYEINDYLGSVRVVTGPTGSVLARYDYYATGARMNTGNTGTGRGRFVGKELQDVGSLDWLDFGARMYDPSIARWTVQDPLAEKYLSWSPYVYCVGDPVNYVDLFGLTTYKVGKDTVVFDDGYLDTIELSSFQYNRIRSSYGKKNYDNVRLIIMNKNGYIDAEGNQVLKASWCSPKSDTYSEWLESEYGNVKDSVGVTAVSTSMEHAGKMYFNEDTGLWMDRKGQFRSMSFNGNQYTGGKLKYAKKMSKRLSAIGSMFSVVGSYKTASQFSSALKSDIHPEAISKGADMIINVASYAGPYCAIASIAWSVYGKYLFDSYLAVPLARQFYSYE